NERESKHEHDDNDDVVDDNDDIEMMDFGHGKAKKQQSAKKRENKKKRRRQHKKQSEQEIVTTNPDIIFNTNDEYLNVGLAIVDFYRRKMFAYVNDYCDYTTVCLTSSASQACPPLDPECLQSIESWFARLEAIAKQSSITNMTLQLYGYFADFYSRFMEDIPKARSAWERMLELSGKDWTTWSTVIEWEQNFGVLLPVKLPAKMLKRCANPELFKGNMSQVKLHLRNVNQIRRLYRMALSKLTIAAGIEYIGEKFKEFERRCGDLKAYREAELLLKDHLAKELQPNTKRKERKRKRPPSSFIWFFFFFFLNAIDFVMKQSEQEAAATETKGDEQDTEPSTKRRKLEPTEGKDEGKVKMEDNTLFEDADKTDTHPSRRQRFEEQNDNVDANENKNDNDNDNDNNSKNKETNNEDDFKSDTNQSLKTIFVVNFRKTCKEDDLRELFSKFGKVVSVRLPWEKPQKLLKGYGYIQFRHKHEAENSLQLNGKEFQGKVLRVERYRKGNKDKQTVHVKGLRHMSKQEADRCIRTIFSQCGSITEIRFTRDNKTQELKGFAYVEFDSEEAAQNALQKDKSMYENRVVETDQKKEREDVDMTDRQNKEMKSAKDDHKPAKSGKSGIPAKSFKSLRNTFGLQPRSILFKDTKTASAATDPTSESATNQPNIPKDQLTNEDYRKMMGL
ncbi:hypothetical protein RFI_00033, partial [Reticulomyxa filosa]